MSASQLACALIVISGLACTTTESTPDDGSPAHVAQPNLLLILADDLGYADLGFTGCTDIPTPHLDRLAAEGIFCTDGHVSASVCAPSRAGLLTGRYQQRSGFECNLAGGEGLLAGTATFPQQLIEAGYQTALVGKWHLGAAEHNHPTALGFEHFTGLLAGSRPYFPQIQTAPGRQRRIERDRVLVPEERFSYLTDLFTDEGVRRIEERDPARPLFLFMSYTAPHGPMHARPDLLERFASIQNPRRRKYAAMVAALDAGVGRLRAALDEAGMGDDTMIVFLSDNGGATNNASDNGTWRGMKGSKWEGGQRVPFVLHWPGHWESGTYASPISSLDLANTFLAAAGADPLSSSDGVDLVPHLEKRVSQPPHAKLFWRRSVARAVREGDWKLIRVEEPDGTMRAPILVDLATDPAELVNRASTDPERVAHLDALLEEWEGSLLPPRWQTGEVWRNNQRKKHEMGLIGREAERKVP